MRKAKIDASEALARRSVAVMAKVWIEAVAVKAIEIW
jgi:hypothetical protein